MINTTKHQIAAGVVAGVLMMQMAVASVMVNDKSIVDEDWNSLVDAPAWVVYTGTDGTAPSTSGGVMTLTLDGATAGGTSVQRGIAVPSSYIVTTRARVTQFDDKTFDVHDDFQTGLQLAQIRGNDLFVAAVTANSLYIGDFQPGGVYWEEISVTTALNTYYTWQFQVTEGPGTATGSVDIYRRESDGDDFGFIGSSDLQARDFADRVIPGYIYYNSENTQTQGILEADYFQLGQELVIPEPSTAVLVVLGIGLMGFRRSLTPRIA